MYTKRIFSFFLFFAFIGMQAQNINTRYLNEEEIQEIFLTKRNPDEAKAFYEKVNDKTYNFVLEYKGKVLFMDALAKNGGLRISFGKSVRFCFKEELISEEDMKLLKDQDRLKLKYDLHNPEFLCSTAFNIFERNKETGEMELRHLLHPVFVTRILEVSVSEENVPTAPEPEGAKPEGLQWPTK